MDVIISIRIRKFIIHMHSWLHLKICNYLNTLFIYYLHNNNNGNIKYT